MAEATVPESFIAAKSNRLIQGPDLNLIPLTHFVLNK